MPMVSIVLPTYNRADTLPRAIASVAAQSFADWELIVVDDGSRDNTADAVPANDPRIRLVRQPNGGCYVARNNGIGKSTGRFVTFLDSDDEWLPHFLELTVGFLQAHPEERFVMTEFWADYGSGRQVREDHTLFALRWPAMAQAVGSRGLDLPPGETDDYLRIYQAREPLGEWGVAAARRAGFPDAFLYRGDIFRHFRWGHMGWLPTTMVRRDAIEVVGLFPENYRTAADYRFLALLSRTWRANMIAVPSAIKHHTGQGGAALSEDHLAAGPNEYRYAAHRLPLFDELFRDPARPDPEIERIRGLYQLYAGRVALEQGRRSQAIAHLDEAARALPGDARIRRLLRLARFVPSGSLAARLLAAATAAAASARAWRRGELTLAGIAGKAWRRVAAGR